MPQPGKPLDSVTSVSAVIVHFNRPRELLKAIQSILDQTVLPREIIVVDNASSEEPALPLNSAVPIRLLRLPANVGPAAARNAGASAATGEVIAFLDDDDEWHADKLARQLCAMEAARADACTCGYIEIPSGRRHVHGALRVTLRDLRHGNVFCGASGLVCRREVFLQHRMDEAAWTGEDWDLFVRLAPSTIFINCPTPLFRYRVQSQSLSNDSQRSAEDPRIAMKLRLLEKHRQSIGVFFYKVRAVGTLLSHPRADFRTLRCLAESVQRFGLTAVTYYCSARLTRRLSRAL